MAGVVRSCPFCEPPEDRVAIRTPHSVALQDSFPVSEGHTLVIPINHVSSVYDLNDEEFRDLWNLVGRVREELGKALRPDAFNVGINDGLAAGQTVEHAHVHVIPRWKGDVADPRGGIRWVIPEKARYWD